MKTRTWIIVICAVLSVCLGLSLWFLLPGADAAQAEIWSDGKLLYTLDLRADQSVTIHSDYGTNTVTIQDGAIAVTEANCPDGYCMDRGFCSSGAQIVCLPHRLVIRFVGEQEIDSIVS